MSFFWLHENANRSTLVYYTLSILYISITCVVSKSLWAYEFCSSLSTSFNFSKSWKNLSWLPSEQRVLSFLWLWKNEYHSNTHIWGFLINDWWCKLIHHTYQNISTVFKDPTSSGYVLCIFDQDKWLARCLL